MSGVPRSLGPLRHEETRIAEQARSVSAIKLVSQVQGLYEVINGVPPPGSDKPIFMAHDHCRRGVSLPRNAQYSLDTGKNISSGQGWRWMAKDSANWYRPVNADSELSYDVSAGARSTKAPACWHVYVTPGIDTDNTAVSTNPCYLKAHFLVSSVTYDSDVRFYNRTRDAVSATVTITALTTNIDELTAYIPCTEGTVNEIDIEFLSTVNNVFILHQGFIGETRSVSQPQTSGTVPYASATRP